VALLRGRAGLAEFSDAAAADPELQTLRRRVSVVPDATLDKMAAIVRAGATTIDAPASRPMDDARLEAKFRELAGARAPQLLETVRSLETQEHIQF
jgi:2-methylcitrate dehydratase PrpD